MSGADRSIRVIREQFVNAFFRNRLFRSGRDTPVADVRRFGATGLIQEFNPLVGARRSACVGESGIPARSSWAAKTGIYQVLALLYAYYATVTPATAGYPTMDTGTCPGTAAGSCYWQLFGRSYALFSYATALASGAAEFCGADPYYTRWQSAGGINVLGPATSAETAGTSPPAAPTPCRASRTASSSASPPATCAAARVVVPPVAATYLLNGGPGQAFWVPAGAPRCSSGKAVSGKVLRAGRSTTRQAAHRRCGCRFTPWV
jgi:hypothetical protein